MFLNGYWRKRADYNRRADSARASLQGAIDYTRKGREALAAKHYSGEGEGSGLSNFTLDEYEYTVPDLLEPIIAYRAWGVDREGYLQPTIYSPSPIFGKESLIWRPKTPRPSRCWHNDMMADYRGTQFENYFDIAYHSIPGEHCKCGYYAAKLFGNIMRPNCFDHVAVGKVALWGKVIKYSKGYRAEYAYPVEFKIEKLAYTTFNKHRADEVGHLVEEKYGALFRGSTKFRNHFFYRA